MSFAEEVWEKIREIPRGKVATYQAVSAALNKNPRPVKIPCHRVVKSSGQIGGYKLGAARKISLLKKEGLQIKNGKIVDFESHIHKFRQSIL